MRVRMASREVIVVLLDSWGKFSRVGDANRIKKWLESQRRRRATRLGRISRSGSAALADSFREDVIAGLSLPQKALPPKYFYDARGSRLFERDLPPEGVLPDAQRARAHARAPGRDRALRRQGLHADRIRQRREPQIAPADRGAAAGGLRPGGHFRRRAAPRRRRRCAAAFRWLELRPVHGDFSRPLEIPVAAGPRAPRGLFSRLDHRQPDAGGGAGLPAHVALAGRADGRDADRRRPEEGRQRPARGLQRRAGRHRGVQPEPARAHQPRAGRRFRPAPLPPLRVLQRRARAHRDAPGRRSRARR